MRIGEVTALQWHDIDFDEELHRRPPEHPAPPPGRDDEDRGVAAEGGHEPRACRRAQAAPDGTEEAGAGRRNGFRYGSVGVPDGRRDADSLHEFPAASLAQGSGPREGPAANSARSEPHVGLVTCSPAGADLAYVSAQLGHANPSITLRIYSHWVPGTRRVTTSILDTESASNRQMLEKNGGEEKEEKTVSY